MAKIELDKYYTPKDLAKKCIDKVYEVIGIGDILEVIEPSAGNGSFSLQIDDCISYDIEPEHTSITQMNFLELEREYQPGLLIIGNPPFGEKMNLAQKFYKKAVELGDYIAFILPISQLSNSNSMYEFDLVYSEDLGKKKYSDVNLHCCFNIYKRNPNGLNSKPKNKLDCVKIVRQDSKGYDELEHDFRICYWGHSAGRVLKQDEKYSAEYKFIVKDEFKDEVLSVMSRINWMEELNCIAMLKIQQFHIINILRKYIPEIY